MSCQRLECWEMGVSPPNDVVELDVQGIYTHESIPVMLRRLSRIISCRSIVVNYERLEVIITGRSPLPCLHVEVEVFVVHSRHELQVQES